jgi:hypothetical protein
VKMEVLEGFKIKLENMGLKTFTFPSPMGM